MGKRVVLAPSARRDLRRIIAEISRDAPERALRFGDRLLDHVEQATAFPLSGRVVPEFGADDIREVILSPYRIIYRVRHSHVEVIRFWHAARGTPELSS